jgi:hypothetical protein
MRFRFRILALTLAIVPSAFGYEYPLSPTAIREAYFRGSGPKGTEANFYSQYVHNLAIPRTAPPVSFVSLDTPYLQIAEHSRDTPNYDAQDAVQEFLNKAMTFRVFTEIYYKPRHGAGSGSDEGTHDIKVRLVQHDREIGAEIADRWDLNIFRDAATSEESIGQPVELKCSAERIDSSPLTVEVETPDGQHAETTFDLSGIK